MRRLLLLVALFVSPLPHAAELGTEPMSIAFDFSEIDMRKDEHHFNGNVRIAQGAMFITSDQAVAVGASRSDRSQWTFQRNVHLQTADVDLRADTATAIVVNSAITKATVKGSLATFEQRNASADKQALGRAGTIEYDIVRGTVQLTNDVWFSYARNEIEGAEVMYYVNEERFVVNPRGKSQGRVNITVQPRALERPQNDPAAPQPESDR